ncbi:MAG TPA: M18 family aminopeptidase [Lachnospiraceae bacterium]|nr:M18 family aminopeptidase [Lachnospiraceae bacterium]
MYRDTAERMLRFIDNNPTAFHVVESMRSEFLEKGYEELMESRRWSLKPGGKYFVCRNGSSMIAFHTGKQGGSCHFHITAAHTDSPAFKIKERAELSAGKKYVRLNTEGYGGMICSSWMDRPLSIAGRVLVKQNDGTISSELLDFQRDMVLIPNVAIHMNRKINEGFAYNKQVDMMPLFSCPEKEDGKAQLIPLIADELNTDEDNILGSDLYVYNNEHPSIWGRSKEFISAPRLDDQECVFAAMTALLETEPASGVINVMACFDNEEVGSGTKQGADSTFLYDVLRRAGNALGMDEEDYYTALAGSFMLSADNAHAVHPNHPEHTDTENCVYMNEGVVIKSHAGQKYTSDGLSIALVKELAKRADVPVQYFVNRSDKAGGSTLGNISVGHVSLNAADIGLAQLAMHSAYETAGAEDVLHLVRLMKEFYGSAFEEAAPGRVRI